MARGRKAARSLDEEILSVEEQIKKEEASLKELKSHLAALKSKKKEEEMAKLFDVMEENGLNVDDIISMLNANQSPITE